MTRQKIWRTIHLPPWGTAVAGRGTNDVTTAVASDCYRRVRSVLKKL
jgi:hypothetical protein